MSGRMSAAVEGATVPVPPTPEMFSRVSWRRKNSAEVSLGSEVARTATPSSPENFTVTATFSSARCSSPF